MVATPAAVRRAGFALGENRSEETTRRPWRLALAGALVGLASPAMATPPPIMQPDASVKSPASDAMVGALPAGLAPGTVVLRGLTGRSETLTAADIAKLPHAHVTLVHGDATSDFSGPLLSDLLRDVGAPMGVRLHGSGVNDVVFVTAADKYRVVLSLAEVDPSFHKGAKVILADQMDGKPLVKEGPYRLVVDGDLKPSRAAYSVVAIELKHLP